MKIGLFETSISIIITLMHDDFLFLHRHILLYSPRSTIRIKKALSHDLHHDDIIRNVPLYFPSQLLVYKSIQ